MSTSNLAKIAACAHEIADSVGTCTRPQRYLVPADILPALSGLTLRDILSPSTYSSIEPRSRDRLEKVIEATMKRCREHTIARYREAIGRLYSLDHCGLADSEVEAMLVQAFECSHCRDMERVAQVTRSLVAGRFQSLTNTRNGFGDQTLRILETAFNYTKSPLSTEIDHLSKLTSLEPHQFQNKRNRGNKPSANNKKQLRTASASHVQSATQLPIIDGRRIASLPSRKYAPPPIRATRPLPRRNAPIQDVPLARTLSQESHESDGTNFSFSSIPSNGGFTGFSYPSIQPPSQNVVQQQPTYNLDPLITATYSQPQVPPFQQVYNPLIPQPIDQYTPYHTEIPTQMSELDFESYLNLNIDNLAPPTEDLGYDLEAQIQAALRPSTSSFETLAPTMSPSEGSPYSDFSNSWFNEFDFGMNMGEEDGEGMELLKVVLDGMSSGSMGGSPIEKTELYPGLGTGGRSESPETVASFALNSDHGSQGGGSIRGEEAGGSGRQSPNIAGPSTSNSIVNSEEDLSFMFNFDLAVSNGMDHGQNTVAGGSGSGSGWVGGVLPYDMDHAMGTA